MSKFKQGDEVYFEDSEGEKFFRVVDKVIGHKIWFTNSHWGHEEDLFFADESLPDVPTEVRYECCHSLGCDYMTVVKAANGTSLQLMVKDGNKFSRLNLTAESALDLSADLLRMALQIKRDSEESDE